MELVASAAAKELVQLKRRKEKKVMLEEMKVRKAQGGYMNYLVPATSTSYTNNSRTI